MTRKHTEAYLTDLAKKNGRITYRSRYKDENGAPLWCTQDRIGTDAKTGTIDELVEWEKGYTQNQSREEAGRFTHPERSERLRGSPASDRHSGTTSRRGRRDGL